jgi:membrane fusion protein, type I secretion system
MTPSEPHASESDQGSASGPAGLQGAALIKELERIQRTLDEDDHRAAAQRRTSARKAPRGGQRAKLRLIDTTMQPGDFSPRPLGHEVGQEPGHDLGHAPGHEPGHEAASPSIIPGHAGDAPVERASTEAARAIGDAHPRGQHDARPSGAKTGVKKSVRKQGALSAAGRQIAALAKHGWAFATAALAFLGGRDLDVDAAADNFIIRLGLAFEKELRNGLRMLTAVALVVGIWMVAVPLAAAVIVPGNLVVQSNVKTIQHPTGGVVAEIAVHDGMRVKAGDLLLRLDATQARANLRMIDKQLNELRLRIARLVAERDGLPQVDLPRELAPMADDDEVKSLLTSERSLFKARGNALQSQRELLQSRIAQLDQENQGIDAQLQSKVEQLDLVSRELTGVQDLFDKKLVPLTRLTSLQRESARIDGERGQLLSAGAETKSKISETKLQIVRVDQDFRTDVVKELGETQGKEAELVERGVAARDMLDRIEMHAPTSGVVHQLGVHTIGGVVRAGDQIMEIVPDTDELQVEARLQPGDIDQVRHGDKAFVRFTAFNQRTTPEVVGLVSYVAADVSHDQQTNAPYFTVRITLPEEERRRLSGLQLVPGMPAEIFMQTGSRTMMSYLFKPITDQLHRTFVER